MKIMGAALRVKQGGKVKRKSWADAYLWMVTMRVKVQNEMGTPAAIKDENGNEAPVREIILIKTPTGQGPWTPQPEDLFAEDWEEVQVDAAVVPIKG